MKRFLVPLLFALSLLAGLCAPLVFVPSRAQVSRTFVQSGTTKPAACSNTAMLFHLTQTDGANAPGLYRCNGSAYVPVATPVSDPSPSYATLTDGATVTWTFTSAQKIQNATLTLGGNRTLAVSGATSGASGTLIVKQDATGGRTLTLPAGSKVIGGGSGVITLTTTANGVDIISFTYDGTNYWWTYGKNYN